MRSVFPQDMCLGKNTFRGASVGFARLRRAKPAGSGVHPPFGEKTKSFPQIYTATGIFPVKSLYW